MYSTYQDYLGDKEVESVNGLKESFKPTHVRASFTGTSFQSGAIQNSFPNKENYTHQPVREFYREQKEPQSQQQLNWGDDFVTMNKFSEPKPPPKSNQASPSVWGPPFWYTLHTSAAHYPISPSAIVRERMKQRILAIPYEIPCALCRPHASAFVENKKDVLDSIVASRENLIKFYVDFHNQVNKRYNKPLWTYDQAFKAYGGTTVSYIKN